MKYITEYTETEKLQEHSSMQSILQKFLLKLNIWAKEDIRF